jgi:hypothetical protein
VTITDNEFWNCSNLSINGNGSNTLDVRHVIIANNRCYGTGISINRIGNTGLSTSWSIHDNLVIGAALALTSVANVSCHDNRVNCDTIPVLPATEITATANVGGGTFAASTYYYVLTGYNSAGETTGSAEVSATVVLNGSIVITWDPMPGVQGYKIYRATSAGAENVSPALVTTIASATTVSYTDTGTATTTGAVPASNTTKLTTVDCITIGATGGSGSGHIRGNLITGGQYGIRLFANCAGVMIDGNSCKYQYKGGITNGTNANTDISIKNNYVLADGTALTSTYQGISPLGTDEVANNTVDITNAPSSTYGIIGNSSAAGMVIKGNKVRATPNVTIQLNGTVTGAIVANNSLDKYISDSGSGTIKYGNTYGASKIFGTAVLVTGTVTVSSLDIRAGDLVLLTNSLPGGTLGILSYGSIINGPGGSFVITSSSNTDTSTVAWQIIH